jgi:phage terminase large subunit-like protein
MDVRNPEILRKLQAEKARRLSYEKYKYYEPSGKTEEFIKKIGNLENFISLYSAANGVGKSCAGANILANMFWPSDNPYFQLPLFQNFPYKKQGRIVTDGALVGKNIVPELEMWFPKGRYTRTKAGRPFYSQWETDTGWSFDIMTYDQEPRQFEGVTLGWAWLDEPPPDVILKAMISRMRRGGIIFITATPLAGSAHLYDQFATGKTEVVLVSPDGTTHKVERKTGFVEADIWSASKSKGIRGHLEDEDINRMIAEYDEDERQARIYGKFQHLVGMVFKAWSKEIHVIKPFNVTEQDYVVWNMLDPHPRNPDAVLWVAADKYGRWFVVDELYINPEDVDDLAARIKKKDSQYRVVNHIADPSAWVSNQHDDVNEKDLATKLKDRGIHYKKATKSRTMADQSIKDALSYTKAADKFIKPPRLYVFETCERTIWEIEHYRWDEHSGKSADNKNRKEKPVDKDDHMVECLGRFCIQEPQFFPVPPKIINTNPDMQTNHDSLDPYA